MNTATAKIVDLSAYREWRAKQRAPAGGAVPAGAIAGVFFVLMPMTMVLIWPVFWPVASFGVETRNE